MWAGMPPVNEIHTRQPLVCVPSVNHVKTYSMLLPFWGAEKVLPFSGWYLRLIGWCCQMYCIRRGATFAKISSTRCVRRSSVCCEEELPGWIKKSLYWTMSSSIILLCRASIVAVLKDLMKRYDAKAMWKDMWKVGNVCFHIMTLNLDGNKERKS